jgi:crossover junction endonuclease MUS81
MNIELLIDIREKKLIESLQNKSIPFITTKLDVGDINIHVNDEPIIIIERKTTNDLDCSIKDGRYKEQKYRLCNLKKENIKVIYLIEGQFKSSQGWSAQINTMVRDDFHVFRVFNIKESVEFIETLMTNLPKYISDLLSNKSNISPEYLDNICVKKKQSSQTDIFSMQLQQIRGLSKPIADCVQSKYKNWKEIVENVDINTLQNLQYEGKTGKSRKIGKVVAERLIENLSLE